MEAYIRGLIPSLAQLRDMPTGFIQMYCRIAAHKFFFFCDPHRRGLCGLSFCYYKELILTCNILISGCQCNILRFEMYIDFYGIPLFGFLNGFGCSKLLTVSLTYRKSLHKESSA